MYVINLSRTFNSRGGYTLLEVIVALIVTSLFLTMMMPAMLAGLKRIELDKKKERAIYLARSKIEWFSVLPDLTPGVMNGEEGDLKWEMTVADTHASKPGGGNASGVALRELKVRVMEPGNAYALAIISAQRLYVLR